MHNPYWDIVRDFPDGSLPFASWGPQRWQPAMYPAMALMMEARMAGKDLDLESLDVSGVNRDTLTNLYSFPIPHPDALKWVVDQLQGSSLVEIGAGTGYWASLLSQMGVDVLAYDKFPVDQGANTYHRSEAYHPVLQGDASSAALHPERVLYLSWPPYATPMGFEALSAYTGQGLLYCGERHGGCTADDDFFDLLHKEWEQVAACESHVTWHGIHDELTLYRRK